MPPVGEGRGQREAQKPLPAPSLPELLYSLIRTIMPRAQRIPAQMSPPTRRLYQSERETKGTSMLAQLLLPYLPTHLTAVKDKSKTQPHCANTAVHIQANKISDILCPMVGGGSSVWRMGSQGVVFRESGQPRALSGGPVGPEICSKAEVALKTWKKMSRKKDQ